VDRIAKEHTCTTMSVITTPASLRADGEKLLNAYVHAVTQYQCAITKLLDIPETGSKLYRESSDAVETALENVRNAQEALNIFREPETFSAAH
jgi:hypothetical protein